MKIRFDSTKARRPTEERGLAVLYAPGKRLAYRVRWYLILLLVASPLLWFATSLARSAWLIEAPALLRVDSLEIRAGESGQVTAVLAAPGDAVRAGQRLVTLENAELDARLARLAVAVAPPDAAGDPALVEAERRLLNMRLARSVARANTLDALRRQGAATESERLAAIAARDQLNSERLAFEMRARSPQPWQSELASMERDAERRWLQTRRDRLAVDAALTGRILEVMVQPGENVGPGTLLMRMEDGREARIWIYLDPREAALAAPWQALEVRMPDGGWLPARVISTADSAARLPADLQPPLGANPRGVLVAAAFDAPLPPHWRIDQLPLAVRFPRNWDQSVAVTEARRFLTAVADFVPARIE